jgi:hypothetical protein
MGKRRFVPTSQCGGGTHAHFGLFRPDRPDPLAQPVSWGEPEPGRQPPPEPELDRARAATAANLAARASRLALKTF